MQRLLSITINTIYDKNLYQSPNIVCQKRNVSEKAEKKLRKTCGRGDLNNEEYFSR